MVGQFITHDTISQIIDNGIVGKKEEQKKESKEPIGYAHSFPLLAALHVTKIFSHILAYLFIFGHPSIRVRPSQKRRTF